VGAAVAALAVCDHLALRRHAEIGVHRLQFGRRLEPAGRIEVVGPFEVDRAGNGAATGGPHQRAVVLFRGPRIDDHHALAAEARVDVAPGGHDVLPPRPVPLGRDRRDELVADRPLLPGPRVEAAIEQLRPGVPEELEKPPGARRADAGALVVDDHVAIRIDAAGRELMLDHPEEGPHRGRIGVDQADAVEVEVHGARQGAPRELLRRPQIDDERTGRPGPLGKLLVEPFVQGGRGDEQLRVGVAGGEHGAA
jgi:hypothetical protein